MYLTNRWTRIGLAFLMTGFLMLCLSQLAAGANPADRTTASQQNDTRKMQETLRDKGYYDGRIDGVAGPRTRAGLRRYQQAEGLPVTGHVDEGTAGKLGIGPESVAGNFKGAGREVGAGGQELGHEMKKGKPIAAGKEMGKSLGRAGVKVGRGVRNAVTTDSDRGNREKARP